MHAPLVQDILKVSTFGHVSASPARPWVIGLALKESLDSSPLGIGGCAAQIQILLEHIRALQDVAVAEQAQAWAQFLLLIDDAWKRIMAQDEKVTFESVTRQLSRAMNHANMPEIAFRLDARIDHLLLDEFQDTSVGQWQALRPLAQEIASTGNADRVRSLLVVGDPKQSIYGWRAGEPRFRVAARVAACRTPREPEHGMVRPGCRCARSAPVPLGLRPAGPPESESAW